MATSENKTAAAAADMVFPYIRDIVVLPSAGRMSVHPPEGTIPTWP
jgi:hypothetical protein